MNATDLYEVDARVRLYSLDDIARLLGFSLRKVQNDLADDTTPLRYTHRTRRKVVDYPTFMAYRDTFRVDDGGAA